MTQQLNIDQFNLLKGLLCKIIQPLFEPSNKFISEIIMNLWLKGESELSMQFIQVFIRAKANIAACASC